MASTEEASEGQPQIIVRVRCVVMKIVTCEGCTLEEAREDPWEHAVDEQEEYQEEYQVLSVKEEK